MQTDAVVGQILAALDTHGLAENTLVIFTADNGCSPAAGTPELEKQEHFASAGFRGYKADIWEGGHRVPFLVQWPARVRPGVAALPIELTDVFATLADIAGAALPAAAAPDSFSFLPALHDPAVAKNTRPFLVHHSIRGVFALREGPWKFVEARGSGGFTKQAVVNPKNGEARGQLYNLAADPAETKNVFTNEPARVARMEALLARVKVSEPWRRESAP
jgi:arylsulfatase A-like enzyme